MNSRIAPRLPAELLSQIFLDVDPHTLYTSIRSLSRSWKQQVEEHLLKQEFDTKRWRVGLRVSRKPKAGQAWRGGIVGREGDEAPGAVWDRLRNEIDSSKEEEGGSSYSDALHAAYNAQRQAVLTRQGALEDELPTLDRQKAESTKPLTHVIPLRFTEYDESSAMLQFNAGTEDWHALFEGCEEGEEHNRRLDLDFSIVWRFPGDGQDDELDGWGMPDQENGWLSRFYCSNFDISSSQTDESIGRPSLLHSSPIARRIRKRPANPNQSQASTGQESNLEWSDEGHEYLSLQLALGTEFFVRRSAQANLLMRRLEVEAEADHRHLRKVYTKKVPTSCQTSAASTPRKCGRSDTSVSSAGSPARQPLSKVRASDMLKGTGSGASTPLTLQDSYASIASSGCSTPKGSLLRFGSPAPRIARIQAGENSGGIRAPFSSTNVSGYTSVQHEPRADGKEAEANLQLQQSLSRASSAITSSKGSPHSVPRASFAAKLIRPLPSSKPLHWAADGALGSSIETRVFISDIGLAVTVWEWSR